jgi:HK97 family phage prohead protease
MLIKKTTETDINNGLDCILNAPNLDRHGDMCEARPDPDGSYVIKGRLPTLLNHNPDVMIGWWENPRVERGALRARLHLASPDTSPKCAEVHKLVNQKILTGVSIGFIALESRANPESRSGGRIYTKMELVEASLVAVPSQADSTILQCRALNISPEIQKMIFKQDEESPAERIRRIRRSIAKVKRVLDTTTSSTTRATMLRSLGALQRFEAEEVANLQHPAKSRTTSPTAQTRNTPEQVEANARALLGELNSAVHTQRIIAEELNKRSAETLRALEAQYRADKQAEAEAQDQEARKLSPSDPGPRHDWGDGIVRWRGVPVGPTTWRGKPVR